MSLIAKSVTIDSGRSPIDSGILVSLSILSLSLSLTYV